MYNISVKRTRFLSTPSGWRATYDALQREIVETISIHALRVEGDAVFKQVGRDDVISIHALRVEGDTTIKGAFSGHVLFLSTPSGWRATHVEDRAG